MRPTRQDPVVARATAPGPAGICVVRLSGAARDVSAITRALFAGVEPEPRRATLLSLRDQRERLIDRVIALRFTGPASYTGEDVLEIQAHGGGVIASQIVEAVLAAGRERGARLAEPGEFTRRAYLNGRLDLAQAEAVASLISARTEAAARAAARALDGELSGRVRELARQVTELRARAEAAIDFADEDIQPGRLEDLLGQGTMIEKSLAGLLTQARQGARRQEGLTVVLVGPPNVGKSTLLNRLVGSERAIVTDQPGTTRDLIEGFLEIEGAPVRLIDTAGLRPTENQAEEIGVARALEAARSADLVLRVLDGSSPNLAQEGSEPCVDSINDGSPALTVLNKADLGLSQLPPSGAIVISAKTGQGVPELLRQMARATDLGAGAEACSATARQVEALARADSHLARLGSEGAGSPWEIVAEELRLCSEELDKITGAGGDEELLDAIFSTFCVGK